MFNPSQADVRRFFCEVYRKQIAQEPMQAIEILSGQWIAEHPEYHLVLANVQTALDDLQKPNPQDNPFLHLSMHLSISEQCSIDQPKGVRHAIEALANRLDSLHAAHHMAMECLSQMLYTAQSTGTAPDANEYVQTLRRLATTDSI
jgi:hypothetical protein